MNLGKVIRNTLVLSTLSTIVATTGCAPTRIPPTNYNPMEGHFCPTQEQLDLRDADLEESTWINNLSYIIEKGDTANELAKNLTKFAEIKYSIEIMPITSQEILDSAGIIESENLPLGIEIIIPIYRPATPLDLLHSRLVGEFGDSEEFNYVISH